MGSDDKNKIAVLRLAPGRISDFVGETAKDSGRVIMLDALTEGIDAQGEWPRLITRRQIDKCLMEGTVNSEPELDEHNNWTCTLQRLCAGVLVSVKCALIAAEQGGYNVVVLDYWRDS